MTTQPEPDSLRQRIAAAVQPILMDTLPKPIARARAQDVADAVLAVVQPVIDEARATIVRVGELHARTEERRALDLSLHPIPTCTGCGERWPCPTTTALTPPVPADGPEGGAQ